MGLSHSEPAECCYRAPGTGFSMNVCWNKKNVTVNRERSYRSLTRKVWSSPYLSPPFLHACIVVIEHRHAVCVPSPATSFFLTMSSLVLQRSPGADWQKSGQWLWNRIFSPGSHCQWASVFVCLVLRSLAPGLAAPRLQLSNESKPSLGGSPWKAAHKGRRKREEASTQPDGQPKARLMSLSIA